MKEVSWGIWLVRLVVSTLLTGLIAWGISFKVADYVVKANTNSIETTLRAMMEADKQSADATQSTLSQINESLQTTNSELSQIRGAIGNLETESSTQITEIAYIRRDLSRVEQAVQDAGIDIKAMAYAGDLTPSEFSFAKWEEVRAKFGITEDEPLFVIVPPMVENFQNLFGD